jgi:hypothetical protein
MKKQRSIFVPSGLNIYRKPFGRMFRPHGDGIGYCYLFSINISSINGPF